MRLLRLYAYYGSVYPKAGTIAGEEEITPAMLAWRAENGLGPAPRSSTGSRATFWRTIKALEGLGLVETVNRFIVREHAQISNIYRLDRLILVLARYIAERRGLLAPRWLTPVLAIDPRSFWSFLAQTPGDRAGPARGAFEDLLSSASPAF